MGRNERTLPQDLTFVSSLPFADLLTYELLGIL